MAAFSPLKELADEDCVWKICGKANWSASKLQPRIDLLHFEFNLFSPLQATLHAGCVVSSDVEKKFHCCHCCIETPRPLSNFIWLNLSRFEEGDRFNEPPLCCPHTSTTSTTNPLVQVKEDHEDHCGWCRRHWRRATDAKTVWRRGRLCVLSPLSSVGQVLVQSMHCARGAVRIVWGVQSLQSLHCAEGLVLCAVSSAKMSLMACQVMLCLQVAVGCANNMTSVHWSVLAVSC